jgi:transcriptional regulator with XRE-family HTH domain
MKDHEFKTYEFAEYIKQRAVEKGLSLSELAKNSNLSRQGLYGILNGGKEARVSTMIALAAALEVHPVLLFRRLLCQLEFPKVSTVAAKYQFDASGFIQDVTIADNSLVTTDSVFTKVWDIQNIGSVDWIGRKLVCMDRRADNPLMPEYVMPPKAVRGLLPTQRMIDIHVTLSSETVLLSVEFTAPSYPCTVISYWKMLDAEGDICFPETEGLSCLVRVISL